MIKKLALSICLSSVALLGARAAVVATDDYETGSPAVGYTGGTGFGAITEVANTGGGVYAENAGTNGRQIDGAQSVGIYSGNGGEVIGRALTSPVTAGTYSVDGRFDIANTNAFSGFDISTGLGASFASGQLLSFGLNPGNNAQFLVTDSAGVHNVSVGTDAELRGGIFNFTLAFNTTAGTYNLTITDKGNGQIGTISGSLDSSGSPVGAVEFTNQSTGNGQNVIFDNTTVSAVPEPATVLLVGPALLGGMFFVRRRRA